jgi:RNA polymerase sigma factor (sigma-70 family)
VQPQPGRERRTDVINDPVAARPGPPWPAELVAIYSAEHIALVRAAFLICGSVAAAEDAVHDAVARVHARWDSIDNGRSYLYVAAVNAARDSARRDERSRRLFSNRSAAPDEADFAALSAESMQLRGALARLPVNQRAAIVLRYFLDWDDDEIARQFNVRPATVRSWVHRGIARLRKDLDR